MVIVDVSFGVWYIYNYENEGWLYFFVLGWGILINFLEFLSKVMNECIWNCSCKDGFWICLLFIDIKICNMVFIKCSIWGCLLNIFFYGVFKL